MTSKEWRRQGAKIWDWALTLLYPHTCPFCGKVVEKESPCIQCRKLIQRTKEPRCMCCGKPLRDETQEYCQDCEGRRRGFDRGFGLWLHGGAVRDAIYQFKYHNRRIYGGFFAKELLSEYSDVIRRWEISLIIPIPLSRQRRRQRGYNQAELIARELSRQLNIPLERKGLVRVRDTRPQKALDPVLRRKNIRRAFCWEKGRHISGNVLLIDDIYTTGTTIESAAWELKRAGAGKVYFLAISIGQGN